VTLVAGPDRLLPTYAEALGLSLRRQLEGMGVRVLTGRRAINLVSQDTPFGPATVSLDDQSHFTPISFFP
jgi:hypothetical protein